MTVAVFSYLIMHGSHLCNYVSLKESCDFKSISLPPPSGHHEDPGPHETGHGQLPHTAGEAAHRRPVRRLREEEVQGISRHSGM